MTVTLLFRAGAISKSTRAGRTPKTLLIAAKHNLRETQAERGFRAQIDHSRMHLNQILFGPQTAAEIVNMGQQLIKKFRTASTTLRKDHVQALEFIVSLPPNSGVDVSAYFRASATWFLQEFGSAMVLSIVYHGDEAAPHIHVLVAPIVNDRYEGGAPVKRLRLRALVKKFASDVGERFGLTFEPKAKLTNTERTSAATTVLDALASAGDKALQSAVWSAVRADIERSPQGYLELLGLHAATHLKTTKMRTFAQIMTSRGRRTSEDKAIRVNQNLTCVGFAGKSHPSNTGESR